jgi:hypothetical protein
LKEVKNEPNQTNGHIMKNKSHVLSIRETKSVVFLISLVVFAIGSSSASAETFTDSQLSGLNYSAPGPGASAGYIPGVPGYANLFSPDDQSGGGLATITDIGTLNIPNGYLGASSFGNLNNILAQGAAGNVSFDLSSMTSGGATPANQYAYWDVVLTDPSNPAFTITINSFSDNQLGKNGFNVGESVDASTTLTSTDVANSLVPFGTSWATVAGLSEDGTPLGDWSVADLSISVGGWDSGENQDGHIDAITVPGGDPVPDAASTLTLLGVCFGTLAGLRRHMPRD